MQFEICFKHIFLLYEIVVMTGINTCLVIMVAGGGVTWAKFASWAQWVVYSEHLRSGHKFISELVQDLCAGPVLSLPALWPHSFLGSPSPACGFGGALGILTYYSPTLCHGVTRTKSSACYLRIFLAVFGLTCGTWDLCCVMQDPFFHATSFIELHRHSSCGKWAQGSWYMDLAAPWQVGS